MKELLVPILVVISGFLCLEFALPISLGEFFAGMVGGFFVDPKELPFLDFLSSLGVLAIMFLAGFEVDIPVLKKNLKANLLIGSASYFIPFGLVCTAGYLLGYDFNASLILGISMSTTSLAIVYSILREQHALTDQKGQLLLGSAMVVDVLSALMLALLFLDFTAENMALFAVIIIALVFFKRATVSIFKRYKGNRFEFELKFLLLVILSFEVLADHAGVHAAIIAFVLGVILSDIEPDHAEIIDRLNSVVYSLLAPIFFFHAGMTLQLKDFQFKTIVLVILFGVLAYGGKYFATYWSFAWSGFRDENLRRFAGALFNYRLSFGIISAMFGLEKGIISTPLYNVILIVIAGSSITAVAMELKWKRRLFTPPPGNVTP